MRQMDFVTSKLDQLPTLSVSSEYDSWRRSADIIFVAEGLPMFNEVVGKDIMRKNAYNPSATDQQTIDMIESMIDAVEKNGGGTVSETTMCTTIKRVLLNWTIMECGMDENSSTTSGPGATGGARKSGLSSKKQTTGTGNAAVTTTKMVLNFIGDEASADDSFVLNTWMGLCYTRAIEEPGDSFVRRVSPSALMMFKMVMRSLSQPIKDKLVSIKIGDLPAIRPELQLILEQEEVYTPLKLYQKFIKASMTVEGKGDLMTYLAHMTTVRNRLKAAKYSMVVGQDCAALLDGLDKATCKAFIMLEQMRDEPETSWDKIINRLQRWAASDYGRLDLKSGGKMRGYNLKSADSELEDTEESELEKMSRRIDDLSKMLMLNAKKGKGGPVLGASGTKAGEGSRKNPKLFEECRQHKVCFNFISGGSCFRGASCKFAHAWPKDYQVVNSIPLPAALSGTAPGGAAVNYFCSPANSLFAMRAREERGGEMNVDEPRLLQLTLPATAGGFHSEDHARHVIHEYHASHFKFDACECNDVASMESAYVQAESAHIYALTDPVEPKEIILDNGANRCITSLVSCAYNIEVCRVVVESASADQFVVSRKCFMDFRVKETGLIITMTDVLLHSECPVELISVSKILAKGGAMVQTAQGAVIKSDDGKVVLTATSKNGLLIANVVPIERANDIPDMTAPEEGHYLFTSRSVEELVLKPRGHDLVRRVIIEHLSMAHVNYDDAAHSIGVTLPGNMPPCWACAMAKARNAIHDVISSRRSIRVGEYFYMDFFGPYQIPTLEGYIYDWIIVEGFSGKVKGYSLRDTTMEVVYPLWEEFHAQHEARFNGTKKVVAILHDNTLSFNNGMFAEHAKKHGYVQMNSAPYEQWMNPAERIGGIINEAVRANLIQSGMPSSTRDWAMQNAISARNNSKKSSRSAENLPVEMKQWTRGEIYEGKKQLEPGSRRCHPYGSLVVVPIPKSFIRNDAGPKAWAALYLVYSELARSHIVYVPAEKKFVQSLQIRSFPLVFPLRSKSPIPLDAIPYERVDETDVLRQSESPQEGALLQDISGAMKFKKTSGGDVFDMDTDEQKPPPVERVPQDQLSNHVNPHISRRRGWNPSEKALARLEQDLNHNSVLRAEEREKVLTPDEVVELTPSSTVSALRGPLGSKWQESVKRAYRLLKEYTAFGEATEVHPSGVRVVGTGNIHKIKCSGPVRLSDLDSKAFKTRTVVFGNNQDDSTYKEVSADVVRPESVRMLAAVATRLGIPLHAADIESAYFNSVMDYELWVRLPPGFDPKSDEIRDLKASPLYAKLLKGVPGIKQGAKLFYDTFKIILSKHGFNPIPADPCVFKSTQFPRAILLIHVDDILLMASDEQARDIFSRLRMDLKIPDYGPVRRFLGIDFLVRFGERERFIHLSQSAMAATVVERAGLIGCSPRRVATAVGNKYTKADCPSGATEMSLLSQNGLDKEVYRSVVAACNWLAMCTRPKLKFAVGKLAKFMNNPGKVHFKQLEGLIRFLSTTHDHGIIFRWSQDAIASGLVAFYDASHNDCPDSMKSTIASLVMMDGAPISWYSKLSTMVARATQHSELFAAELALTDVLWARMLMQNLNELFHGEESQQATSFLGDNKGVSLCLTGSVNHATNKHVKQKIFLIRQEVPHSIAPSWISKLDNPADGFTKPGVVQNAYDSLECAVPCTTHSTMVKAMCMRQSGGHVANLNEE